MAAVAAAAAAVAGAAQRSVARIISSKRVIEGGGFEVRRPFGGGSFIDPFIMVSCRGPEILLFTCIALRKCAGTCTLRRFFGTECCIHGKAGRFHSDIGAATPSIAKCG